MLFIRRENSKFNANNFWGALLILGNANYFNKNPEQQLCANECFA